MKIIRIVKLQQENLDLFGKVKMWNIAVNFK